MPRSNSKSKGLLRVWQARGPLAWLLLPAGLLFFLLVVLRRWVFRCGWRKGVKLPVPVVVVGNIVVGGAGKTPLTLWLSQRLRAAGWRPGIVSRGYGRTEAAIREVGAGMTAQEAGDEPLLLARRSGCPVFVGSDRIAAARALLGVHPDCNLVLCDDGLQHYRLGRDFEIAVLDNRGVLNGWPLPAGPLREPVSRLGQINALVLNDTAFAVPPGIPCFAMRLEGRRFYRLDDPKRTCTADDLGGYDLVAVAGIGAPQRFFDHLAALGLRCANHPFPDHHHYTAADLAFDADAILTTEKDALKCVGLTALPIWVLPVEAVVEPDLAQFIGAILNEHVILETTPDGPATA